MAGVHSSTRYSTTKAAAGFLGRGVTDVDSIYSARRLYALTQKIVEENRQYAPLIHILTNKMGTMTIDDPEPKIWLDSDWEGKITPDANQSGTAAASFTVSVGTTNINFINVGDTFTINGIYYRPSATVHYNDWTKTPGDTNNDGSKIYANEMIRVTSVDKAAGDFTCARGDGTDTTVCDIVNNTDSIIGTTNVLISMASAFAENSKAPVPISFDLDQEQMYTQITKGTYGMSRTEMQTKDWFGGGEEKMQKRRRKAVKDMLMKMERSVIFGRAGKVSLDSAGHPRRTTGGIIEYIATKSGFLGDSLVKVFNLNTNPLQLTGEWQSGGLIDLIKYQMTYGTSTKKLALCGQNMLSFWAEMFVPHFRVNDTISKSFGIEVLEFSCPHGTLYLAHDPLFTIGANTGTSVGNDQNWSNNLLVLDMNLLKLIWMQPIVHKDITDADTDGVLWQVLTEWGLYRSFPDAHSWVINVGRGN